jgi:lipoprotein-anchoring transpeptidase ErfK/SrfK
VAAPSLGEHGFASRRRRTFAWLALGALALLLLLALGAYLYDRSQRDVIAPGVRIDGIAVGGLHADAARSRLQRELVNPLREPVTVRSGGRSWTLAPDQANVRIDVAGMVEQALRASREGSIFSRTAREVFGGSVDRNVPLTASYSHEAVRALTNTVAGAVNRPARDATVQPSASSLNPVPSEVGLTVARSQLGARIDRALLGLAPTHTVHVPTHDTQPKITSRDLAATFPAYIVVDRAEFKLRFFSHLRLAKTYEIAVGMEGLETPAGLHHIEWEQVDPPWYVPKKAWAGALAGTVVPPGPADPLKARFMSFEGGAGIHGIDPSEYSSIGHDASHGCIRMRIPDVIALYSKSPVGTPVYII